MLGLLIEERYELVGLIAEGGMGSVYRALDRRLDRIVAVKLLGVYGDALTRARFAREARALARLSHPNINAIFDAGEQEDRPYLVLEFVDGFHISAFQLGPYWLIVDLLEQAFRALAYAHGQGIVHRDIKPANLMVTGNAVASSASWLLKILDYGVAALTKGSRITGATEVTGTPTYLAPEQATGSPIDGRADLYSLGVVLYELLTGRPPFVHASPVTVMYHHVNVPPEPPSSLRHGLPAPLEQLVLRLIAKDPDQRFHTAQEALFEMDKLRLHADVVASRAEVSTYVPIDHLASSPSKNLAELATADETSDRDFVGRHVQLEGLRAAFQAAAKGRPQAVAISGPIGIGKTRLLREFAREAIAEGATILYITCRPDDRLIPYSALRDILRGLSPSHTKAEIRYLLGDLSEALEPLLEPRSDHLVGTAADAARVPEAASLLFNKVMATQHAVLVLDQAEHLDAGTAHVLRYLMAAAATPYREALSTRRLLLLIAARDDTAVAESELSELLNSLRRQDCLDEFALSTFNEGEMEHIVRGLAYPPAPDDWVQCLTMLSQGETSKLRDIIDVLVDANLLARSSRGWSVASASSVAPPSSIEEILRIRVADLSEACVSTLTQACVLGEQFDVDVVAHMRMIDQLSPDDVSLHLMEALRTGLLRELDCEGGDEQPRRLEFVQPIIRIALYESMSSMRKRRLHRRAADVLAERGVRPEVSIALLTHLYALGDSSAISVCAAVAARRAVETGDDDEAARLFHVAIDVIVTDDGRSVVTSLLRELATVQRRIGRFVPARKSLVKLAEISTQRAAWTSAAVARSEAAETACCAGRLDEIESDSRLALASSIQVGQPGLMARALSCLAVRQSLGGDWSEALRTLRIASQTEFDASPRASPDGAIAHYAAALAMSQSDRLLDSLARALSAWDLTTGVTDMEGLASQTLLLVVRALIALGDAPRALEWLARESVKLNRGAGLHATIRAWLALAETRAALGDWGRAAHAAAASLAGTTDPDESAAASAVLTECLFRMDDFSAAANMLEVCARFTVQMGPFWHGSARAYVSLASRALELDRLDLASSALDRADRANATQRHTRARLLGLIARSRLLVLQGDVDRAWLMARRARDDANQMSDPVLALRARLLTARLSAEKGKSEPIERPEEQYALATMEARQLGDRLLMERVEDERLAAGVNVVSSLLPVPAIPGVVVALKDGLLAQHEHDGEGAQRFFDQASRLATAVGGGLAATCRLYAAEMLATADSPRHAEAERLLFEARRLFGSEGRHDDVDDVDVRLHRLSRLASRIVLSSSAASL